MDSEILPAQSAVAPGPFVPFEDPAIPGFWARVGAMFQLLFAHPFALFERTPAGEGLTPPWRFLLLLAVPWMLFLGLILGIFGLAALVGALSERSHEAWLLSLLPLGFFIAAALLPVVLFLGMVVGGAVNHACLWLWGGTKNQVGLAHTIRAVGYAHAFVQLGAWIPYLGAVVQLLGMVWIGMGLARMHRTDPWRGIAAVLTPLLFLCVCLFAVLAFLPLILLAAGHL